ncbi:hypothetical protein [Natronospira bacteriovora]|uniref:Uncharacterized protein n=1 Tax=Natronospira bacteriovora TaxID=3069753 RepID=A0ABU0W5M7_9GAMM|nr:hypothetical protein [Natronospira sp. AB-CW4]MDQ2069319.1 hypothetical protein [Natronospira sp. AB-CW4]
MSLDLMLERVKTLLPEDEGLAAWAQQHFGKPIQGFKANKPFQQIHSSELPALYVVTGNGQNALEVGNEMQRPEVTVPVAFIWHEQDPEKAVQQSAELVDLMVQALMVRPELADDEQDPACEEAHVARFQTDAGNPTGQPRHWIQFEISAIYEVFQP